jgi:hypothetical protein
MSRLDVAPDYPLLVRTLRHPQQLPSYSFHELSRLIDVAAHARLLGWLLTEFEDRQLPSGLPDWLQDRLLTMRALVREYERGVRWEIDRLHRAFMNTGLRWILLKGAAYVAASLPSGRGRKVADIDVLVPRDQLENAERALNIHGWRVAELEPYDERYYRNWMHELPPMVHDDRKSVVDLHHAILPLTSRLRPSSDRLLARAMCVDDDVQVLCPSHMVLHAAAHLFHDGEVSGAVRDIVDLDSLLRSFSADASFWPDLIQEAQELDLTRPAYYALRYACRLLDTPIPPECLAEFSKWAPIAPVRLLMDALVERTLTAGATAASSATATALYVRSHWLRMPPFMLARHLLTQSMRRRR